MKKILVAAVAALSFALLSLTSLSASATDKVQVDITQIVAHPALDAVRKGVEDYLEQQGYKKGENLTINFQSAQGNIPTATQIARQFVGEEPNVIVAIATPSAQTMAATTKEIPIVFSAVSDPVEAKLVASLEKPGANVTGVSDRSPVDEHIKLLKEIFPDLKNIGYLYNAGEANSVSNLKLLEEVAKANNINVIPSSASKASDVQAATRSLLGKVDVIYVPTDNMIISVLEGVSVVALESQTPLFTADASSIGRGPFAAQGINYYDAGLETGKLVERILKGEKPADIAVTTPPAKDISIDLKAAEKLGVTVPQAVIDRAAKVIR
ncbi:ABC transporter substrate-binding protein [Bartonella sp. HY761]|uniref:ABC transporter substrate-binding protein n=1 Tax=Bartonella sp. HY761 TaxID=2979330 RepID=UPI0021E26E09|nr:ABC transporter substrate-binding protein [Bartonella sp. HY761]UXN08043.1 ABC transporter substrate-binding protein [Bartonella sp. HY761]